MNYDKIRSFTSVAPIVGTYTFDNTAYDGRLHHVSYRERIVRDAPRVQDSDNDMGFGFLGGVMIGSMFS